MVTINLKGREIPLIYTTYEMKQIQEEIAPMGKLQYILSGQNPDDEKDSSGFGGAEQIGAVAKLVRILGNAGLEEAGQEPDLTNKKVLRALRPAELANAINLCMEAMAQGMETEFEIQKEDGPVDVTLEEMNKKKVRED